MKKTVLVILFPIVAFIGLVTFDQNVSFGSTGAADSDAQQFLSAQPLCVSAFAQAEESPHDEDGPDDVHRHEHPPVELQGSAPAVATTKDTVPNFSATPTIISRRNGEWFSAATWAEGRIPDAQDVVKIAAGHTVTYAGVSDVALAAVGIEGTLRFSVTSNTRLKVGTLLVNRTGRLHIGTESSPITTGAKAELIIANRPLATILPDEQTKTLDPQQFGTGLISFGEVLMHGAKIDPTWVRLAQEPRAGQSMLVLESAPSGWHIGDKLVLPDTRQTPLEYQIWTASEKSISLQLEELTVAAISGNTVTLTSPLRFDHPGGKDTAGALVARPHVANVTRNVVVRSESAAGVRGHTLFTERARIDTRYAAFENLGRTKSSALDSTVIDGGVVKKIGVNQIGRYPIHFHHLMGPRNSSNRGFQFAFVGNSVVDGLKWSVAVHNSHFGLVTNNVIYDADGAGIMTEQGNERENVFDRNFAVKIGDIRTGPYNPTYGGVAGPNRPLGFADFGWEGSAFWFNGNDNYVRNNVAANVAYAGVMYNGRSPGRYWFNSPVVPKFRGAAIETPAEWVVYAKVPAPEIRESRNNEVYASAVGTWVGFSGTVGTLEKFLHWNIKQTGVYAGRNSSVTFDGFTIVSDQSVSNRNEYGRSNAGIDFRATTYTSGGVTVRNAKVEGFNYGIFLPGNIAPAGSFFPAVAPITVIANTYLRNYVNVVEYSAYRSPKTTVLRDIILVQNPGPVTNRNLPLEPKALVSAFQPNSSDSTAALSSRTFIFNYNKVPGNNFEFFFKEQAPDFVMAPMRPLLSNCPTPGLTNKACFETTGVATLGNVATCQDASTRPEIGGFTCPIPSGITYDSILSPRSLAAPALPARDAASALRPGLSAASP